MHSKQMKVSYSIGNKKNKHVYCKHIALWSDLVAGVKGVYVKFGLYDIFISLGLCFDPMSSE